LNDAIPHKIAYHTLAR